MLFPAQPLFQKLILSQASWLYSPKTVHIKHPCGAKLGFANIQINTIKDTTTLVNARK